MSWAPVALLGLSATSMASILWAISVLEMMARPIKSGLRRDEYYMVAGPDKVLDRDYSLASWDMAVVCLVYLIGSRGRFFER
ncbi:hypothetical protein BDW66DRAFT_90866 [Aspergillus desertorum]